MTGPTLTHPAAVWLYDQGAPTYQARAFGDYHAAHVSTGVAYPAAKRQFDYDPWAQVYLHRYGSTCYGNHLSAMCAECRTWAQFGE